MMPYNEIIISLMARQNRRHIKDNSDMFDQKIKSVFFFNFMKLNGWVLEKNMR